MEGHVLFAVVFQLSLTLAALVHSQNQSGFVSIDCGLVDEPSYIDKTTSINYTSDANLVSTGTTHKISSKHKTQNLKRQFWNVRRFPEGRRNCYTLNAPQGSSSKYLVRAMFMYGNYDGKSFLPKFDLYLGAKWWDSVMFENASEIVSKEIVYAASSDYVHVCLFDTNNGTPFISVLELRALGSDNAYPAGSLEYLARFDFGLQDGELVRNLSFGGLIGSIAPDISNLKSMEYLDLSNNSLVGDLPSFLSQLSFLRVLNLEGNQLSGKIPTELIERSKNGSLKFSFGGNPNLCSSGTCKRSKAKIVIPVVASLAGAFMLLAAIITFCVFKRRQPEKLNSYSGRNKELELKKQKFTYAEVLSITNNFEKVVGKGAFGTVYHGFLNNTQVAVKVLSSSAQGYQQFQAEAKLLARVHHKRLTALVGYCEDGTNIALIYEYMANGDLAKHLSERNENILGWKQRLQIAVDAAEGLEYLHKGCKPPIVHRDVKSRNILLSHSFRGKIADFGLSKIFPDEGGTYMSTVIAGTPGYLDPEYNVSNRLSEKSDVYSFGVVLLGIITGRPAITKTEDEEIIHIIQWVRFLLPGREIDGIVDPRLLQNFDTDSASKALDTALACVAPASINRPTMSHVVMELRQCLAMVTTPAIDSPNDFSFGGISESSLGR